MPIYTSIIPVPSTAIGTSTGLTATSLLSETLDTVDSDSLQTTISSAVLSVTTSSLSGCSQTNAQISEAYINSLSDEEIVYFLNEIEAKDNSIIDNNTNDKILVKVKSDNLNEC